MHRSKTLLILALAFIAAGGCALHTKPIGAKDPAVEVAKENGTTIRALAEAMRAQAEAMAKLAVAAAKASPTAEPTPEQ